MKKVKSSMAVPMAAALALLSLGALPASAQQAGSSEERPWARGIPPDKQKTALELFRAGNTLL